MDATDEGLKLQTAVIQCLIENAQDFGTSLEVTVHFYAINLDNIMTVNHLNPKPSLLARVVV